MYMTTVHKGETRWFAMHPKVTVTSRNRNGNHSLTEQIIFRIFDDMMETCVMEWACYITSKVNYMDKGGGVMAYLGLRVV